MQEQKGWPGAGLNRKRLSGGELEAFLQAFATGISVMPSPFYVLGRIDLRGTH
ncbi:hypothetical protein HMSSN139_52750 [Paenibacillus sp. HMSSN-139]|nr:hypothetical protein HMSSN139_52750 [Paenibacillus sp. HMSSN-139]